jgi:hypothetical protein
VEKGGTEVFNKKERMNLEEPDTADFVGLISGRAAEGGLLPGLYSEDEVASRFGITRRMVRERALEKGIGLKYGRKRFLTEADTLKLGERNQACSNSQSVTAHHTGTFGGPSTDDLSMRLQRKETKAMLADLRQNLKSRSPSQRDGNVTPLHSKKPPHST